MKSGNEQRYDDQKLMLSVDTSTTSLTTALTRGGKLLGEITSKAERNHSLYLIPTLQRLMKDAGIRPKELSAFTVGLGPGSYTGVRIGVTVAKTFAWTHKLALMGVSTLEAMALGCAVRSIGLDAVASGLQDTEQEETISVKGGELSALETVTAHALSTGETLWIVPLIDARRGQAFTALYAAGPSGWTCVIPDGIRLSASWMKDLLARMSGGAPNRIVFTGEPDLHQEAIHSMADQWNGPITLLQHGLWARHTAELGRRRWLLGETDDVYGLVPNYTQLAEAEAKLLAKKS